MLRKTASFILIFVLLSVFASCGNNTVPSKSFDAGAKDTMVTENVIAENSSFRLEWDDNTKGVILTDLQSSLKWGTTPIDNGAGQVDEFGMPIKKHPKVNSAISISYLDSETNTVIDATSYTGAVENGRVRCAKGKNSILVEFYFDGPKIMVPVQYILQKDHLQIKVCAEDIQEEKNKVIKISIAPFICAVENDSPDSYIFVPSGSGALITPVTLSQQGVNYSSQVYGSDSTIEVISKTTETENVRLPVYGVRTSAEKGLFAIIDNSSDSAFVEVNTGASAYGYSTVFASFQVRGYTGHVANLFSGLRVENMVFSDAKIQQPLSVSFYPLVGPDADYSGMARLFRNYLEKNFKLSHSCEDISLNLTVLGGMMLTDSFCGIPYDRLYAVTTLKEAHDILTDVATKIKMPFNAILKGFGTTGVDIGTVGGGFKIASNLGSGKEISALQEFCKNNSAGLYIDFDLVRFAKSGKGFSKFGDACYNAGEKKATQYLYNPAVLNQEEATRHYLLTPARINDAVKKLLKAGKKMGIDGLSLSTLSSMSYSDYKSKTNLDYYSKNGFSKMVTDNLLQIRKSGFKVAASGANSYAAVLSDVIMNVPTKSDGEHIFYTDIPFYEMVFKGSVPLSVGSINLCENSDDLILKAVEGGCGLNYTIINHWSNKLITSDLPIFYNSVYSEIQEDIFANAERLSDYYESINGAHIIEHKLLTKNLRRTVFDNHVEIYVNYGNSAIDSPVGTIEAKSFIVTKGEAA